MKVITTKTEVYKFKELSEEAKQKAIEKLYDINVDYEWWENDDYLNEIAKEDYGIVINMSDICFELDRGNYLYFETYNHGNKENYEPGIYINDHKKFFKKAGLKLNLKNDDYFISIGHTHGEGSYGFNYISESMDCELSREDFSLLEACLKEFIDFILISLKENYEYLLSEKAIIETIEANDYEFTIDGKLF